MGVFSLRRDSERSSIGVVLFASFQSFVGLLLLFMMGVAAAVAAPAPCAECASYGPARTWTTNTPINISDASGLAASAKNPGVLWVHNDSGGDNTLVYAIATNGALIAAYDILADTLVDFEDMAIGPGPLAGMSYLYIGDIGTGGLETSNRATVRIFRALEPEVIPGSLPDSQIRSFAFVQQFTLEYPDGSYDADAMMVDPLTGDVLIGAKQPGATRVYRARLANAPDGSTIRMELIATSTLGSASGGAISADGTRIVLRNERNARLWFRCPGESISAALARSAIPIPLVGTQHETNGEAIAFLPSGAGYLTLSDGVLSPPLFFLPLNCSTNGTTPPPPPTNAPPLPPLGTRIVTHPAGATVEPGSHVKLFVVAEGRNLKYQWSFNGAPIPGAVSDILVLTDIQPNQSGRYVVIVTGDHGTVASEQAVVVVRSMAPEPVILIPPQSMFVARGGSDTLAVYASGEEPLSYSWTRNGQTLSTSGPELSLRNMKNKGSGFYRVTVSNNHGFAEAEAEVQVIQGPSVRVSPGKRTVRLGATVVLRAVARGAGPLEYQWMFNNQHLPGENGSTLVISGADYTSEGLYSVVVSNPAGVASDGATLKIRD
jgi:hypothetical protein